MSLFQTKITVEPDTPIIALSDIHADIDSLIIALRDCAQVIKKKTNQNVIKPDGTEFEPQLTLDQTRRTEENIRHESGDQLLEYLLSLDLNVPENDEIFNLNVDLGYEWIGGKSHVVIIGDILDGIRAKTDRYGNGIYVYTPLKSSLRQFINQYPQIEVKILKFLNKLDELAHSAKGKVIKLIGNHEHMNFKNSIVVNYAFGNDITPGTRYFENVTIRNNNLKINEIYYNGLSRSNYFNIEQEGYDLYTKRGTGVLLILDNTIHQTIFCHGTLANRMTFKQIDNINEIINNGTLKTDFINSRQNLTGVLPETSLFITSFRQAKMYPDEPEDILWGREMGEDTQIDSRFDDVENYCKNTVNPIITSFCNNGICNIDKVKIILGHCTQNYSTFYDSRNRTFKKIIYSDDKIEKYDSSEIHEGKADLSNNVIFGITMECDSPKQNSDNPGDNKRIYRVDVGASRGFDQDIISHIIADNPNIDGDIMKRYLHSRTPQVLYMQNGNFQIIKSKYENTRKHQPRIWLEQTIDGFGNYVPQNSPVLPPPPQVTTVIQPGGYKQKYLKYKQKYLQLKKNLIKFK